MIKRCCGAQTERSSRARKERGRKKRCKEGRKFLSFESLIKVNRNIKNI
jgi:hypothetical protein